MAGLRARALDLDPVEMGYTPTIELPRVFGGVMEMAFPEGSATLVSLLDGATSLYTSGGGGIIGGGEHESVVAATQRFLLGLEAALDELGPDAGTDVPPPGTDAIHALTYSGRRSLVAPEAELAEAQHPQSALFYLAHDVITALRLVEEQRSSGGAG